MTVMRPMCAVCSESPREPGTARCYDCGPGRLNPRPNADKDSHDRTITE